MKPSHQKIFIKNVFLLIVNCLLLTDFASAQFSIGGQMIQRGEFRHGYGKLIPEGTVSAVFITQRLRFQATYKWEKLTLYGSLQDIRTWGNTSQGKLTDNLLSVHEAWLLLPVGDYWAIQLGRQELNYDNVRFLGNADWVPQARAHDFVRIKYERDNLKLHFGAGFNQGGEALSGNVFTVTDQYKTAQLIRFENHHKNFDYSLFFWNNGRQYILRDSLNQIIDQDTRFTQTLGISSAQYKLGNAQVSGFYYHQLGKDLNHHKVNAFDVGCLASYILPINKERESRLKIMAGFEIISGTDQNSGSDENHSFEPMYGTNHVHNGYMDYFFVGGRHLQNVGLRDASAGFLYYPNARSFFSSSLHVFAADGRVFQEEIPLNKNLGTELDFTFGFVLNKATSLQAGYSQMFSAPTLEYLHGVNNPSGWQGWSYLMLIFRPDSDKKFIGVVL